MDAKDLRTESALGARNNDGSIVSSQYSQGGAALQAQRNKSYHDIGSNTLAKVDTQSARPCAVIGPDRVVPPPVSSDTYPKKAVAEPWPSTDNIYRRPPEYPYKLHDYQNPSRNISPRQTFQENMQRIMVPTSYNTPKVKEDHNFPVDANISPLRNNKLDLPTEANYFNVPYAVNPMTNEQTNVRSAEVSVSNINPVPTRSGHDWYPGAANIQPAKSYGARELYQYPEYPSCAGPRPVLMTRPHRTVHEESGNVFADPYQRDGNMRYKPYQTIKERYPQPRYEYIGNYTNPFHPPTFPTHKYDIHKTVPYPGYPQVPPKYLDSRTSEPVMNEFQRPPIQQISYNSVPFTNQAIHPPYGSVPGNCLQSKFYSYPPDGSVKAMTPNKSPYDTNNKMFIEYDNGRTKSYPLSESYFVNEMARPQPIKGQVLPPNYASVNMHTMPPHPYYRKDNPLIKGCEYGPYFRNFDPAMNMTGNPMSRFPPHFSLNKVSSDSNASHETAHIQSNMQEGFGYMSQSSLAAMRSVDPSLSRLANDPYRRYDYRYGPSVRMSPLSSKSENNPNRNAGSNIGKKNINVRQFLQMWSEGEDESGENNTKESKVAVNKASENAKQYEVTNQEQLYVLDLVNVPSEELDKYEHIQKVSKLPENIKGYNSIELLNQFEEVIEYSNLNHFNIKPPIQRDINAMSKTSSPFQAIGIPSRPLSPLDVEAKISQSVIHKEVGCNFEIKPCSPKMLNAEGAAPVQTILAERVIEKVTNQLSTHSPILHNVDENLDKSNNTMKNQEHRIMLSENPKVPSCKMINNNYTGNNNVDAVKSNYTLQDLESNSGVCFASLPRLDNDCELNFQEVNQQFINANKVESVITRTQDLPMLNVVQSEVTTKDTVHVQGQDHDGSNFSPKIEPEKEFQKLSKYRKIKRQSPEVNELNLGMNPQVTRTDSVIIKNPDNIKTLDELAKNASPTIINNEVENYQQDPINLTINTEVCTQQNNADVDSNIQISNKWNDIAIDFSLSSKENDGVNSGAQLCRTNSTESLKLCDHPNPYSELEEKAVNATSEIVKNNLNSAVVCKDNLNFSTAIIKDTGEVSKLHDCDGKNTESHIENDLVSESSSDSFKPTLCESNITNEGESSTTNPTNTVDSCNIDNREEIQQNVGEKSILNEKDQSSSISIDKSLGVLDEEIHDLEEFSNDETLKNLPLNVDIVMQITDPDRTPASDSLLIDHQLEQSGKNKLDDNICDYVNHKTLPTLKSEYLENNVIQLVGEMNPSDEILSKVTQEEADEHEEKVSSLQEVLKENVEEMALHSLCGKTNTNRNKAVNVLENKYRLNKELFSPWIQKLFCHSEGICNRLLENRSDLEVEMHWELKTDCSNDSSMSSEETEETEQGNVVEPLITASELSNSKSECLTNNTEILIDNACEPLLEKYKTIVYLGDAIEPIKEKVINVCELAIDRSIDTIEETNTTERFMKNTETYATIKSVVDKKVLEHTEAKTSVGGPMIGNIERESTLATIETDSFCDAIPDSLSDNSKPDCYSVRSISNEKICEPMMDTFKLDPCLHDEIVDNAIYEPDWLDSNSCTFETVVVDHKIKELEKDVEFEHRNFSQLLKSETRTTESDSFVDKYDSIKLPEEILTADIISEDEDNTENNEIQNRTNIESDQTNIIRQESGAFNCILTDKKDCTETSDVDSSTTYNEDQSHVFIDIITEEVVSDKDKPISNCINIQYTETDTEYLEYKESSTIVNCDVDKHKASIVAHDANIITDVKPKGSQISDYLKNTLNVRNNQSPNRKTQLKRSLSDSALNAYNNFGDSSNKEETKHLFLQNKRKKIAVPVSFTEPEFTSTHFCNIIHNNRRNSVSAICNEENVSFCILIDENCIITEECEETEKICYTEVPEDCLTYMPDDSVSEDRMTENVLYQEEVSKHHSYQPESDCAEGTPPEDESWVEDVACVETVVSDDIAEDIVISTSASPKDDDSSDNEFNNDESEVFSLNEHTNKLKYIYGDKMCNDDAQLVETLYRTPQMNVNKTLIDRESLGSDDCSRYYDKESLERVLSESNTSEVKSYNCDDIEYDASSVRPFVETPDDKENVGLQEYNSFPSTYQSKRSQNIITKTECAEENIDFSQSKTQDDTVHSYESSVDNVFSYNKPENNSIFTISRSPEVSSTTSEDKNASLLLKISKLKGATTSQVSDIKPENYSNTVSCKYTEEKGYSNSNNHLPNRPLLTKGAQKYIPPLKEPLSDLKVKLPLPQQSLIKLKKMKISKEKPNPASNKQDVNKCMNGPKKNKPKFEDVLMSIDEIQIKMHKDKNKKTKKSIPKVVIKKNEYGSHYASTSEKGKYNPDLTGRKWQPWVFLEKYPFIDKMALKGKTKAIYNYRTKTFVLKEKFKKYKSISNTKFIISKPKLDQSSSGKLKYTIRLKHSYS